MYSIDPDAVRGHELPVSFRGYDREKTNALLENVALAYERALEDRARLEARVKELEGEVEAYLAREEEFREERSRVGEQARALMEETENKCRLVMENAREAAERLRKAEQEYGLGSYEAENMYFGMGHPWQFIIDSQDCVRVDDFIPGLDLYFPVQSLAEVQEQINKPDSSEASPKPYPEPDQECITNGTATPYP